MVGAAFYSHAAREHLSNKRNTNNKTLINSEYFQLLFLVRLTIHLIIRYNTYPTTSMKR